MATDATQTALPEYATDTTTETVTRTVICHLETSNRKNERLRPVIEEWQAIADRMADLLPTFPTYRWGNTTDTHLYRVMKREFPDTDLYAANAHEAAKKVTEAFGSWDGNGRPGNRPEFGGGDYARFRGDHITVEANDRGWGLGVKLRPNEEVEWWHIVDGSYQRDYLRNVTDGDYETGSAELHVHPDGSLACHLTVKHDVDVYEPDAVPRRVGVDVGETALYALAVVTTASADIEAAEVERGREFRHYRERLQRKKDALQAAGDLRGVRKTRGHREKYTEHTLHEASRAIVDRAIEHAPCVLVLEDLTGYRESASDAIHDWPYASLHEKIMYKATEAGIPVETAPAAGTSTTCRHCRQTAPEYRDGVKFKCRRCHYEVHADVNAAINIALGLPDD